MNCTECGGFVPLRDVQVGELVAPQLKGSANCVRCGAPNVITNATLFLIDGQRLRRIRLSAPVDEVK
ncbi:MAG TPA: hypothetical protein VJN70_02005 [Gemmatimonadaceae bacterium]|nr:hypothetical protein [Gemmatimonadaceae bacterium]